MAANLAKRKTVERKRRRWERRGGEGRGGVSHKKESGDQGRGRM